MKQPSYSFFANRRSRPARPGPSGVVVAGTVTEISGAVVLVEEDPSSDSGGKGFFTMTDATEITLQRDGEVVRAALEDLAVGQFVEAAYAGPIMESYPSQGDAASIAILEEDVDCPFPGGCDDTATLSLELTVEGEPPAGTTFSGVTELESFITAPLTDPDGDGLYAGSLTVPATSGGQGGPPEPLSLPVQILQGSGTQGPDARGPLRPGEPIRVIEDFGTVVAEDRTFEASVSFCDGGGNGPDPVGGGDANDYEGGDGPGGGGPSGGLLGGINILPATGGAWAVAGLAGLALVAGGLLVRRIFR